MLTELHSIDSGMKQKRTFLVMRALPGTAITARSRQGALITFQKQPIAHTMKSAKRVHKILHEVKGDGNFHMPVWSDNESAMMKDGVVTKRRKFIE